MFNKKVSSLLSSKTENAKNSFVKEAMKASNTTLSGEGSLKYTTSGDDFVDDFANIARYKEPRSYAEVSETMQRLWSQDPVKALKMTFYIRTITRKTKLNNGEELGVQKGQGLKHEAILRMIWIAINHPKTFAENIKLFIAVGSWKDIFTMLNLDLQYHGWQGRKLDWNLFYTLITQGLCDDSQMHLVKKYLPTIRTNKRAKTLEAQADTLIGRWLAKNIALNYLEETNKIESYKFYRQLKAKGLAHKWQQQISKQLYNEIEFNKIAGRALNLLVNSKFLDNHDLREKYTNWITSQKTAKYTGFVFELFKPLDEVNQTWERDYNGRRSTCYTFPELGEAEKATINAQFNHLVEVGKDNQTNFTKLLVAKDISGSMTAQAIGCNISAYSIAKALALYFSEFLTGPFADCYVNFDDECQLLQWKGNTPVDKWINDNNADFGGTDPLTIAELLVKVKNQGIPESEFPEGVLMLSDGDFSGWGGVNTTTFHKFYGILREGGFSEEFINNFKLILWDIPNHYYGGHKAQFEEFADYPNVYQMSGFDGSIISFLIDGGVNPCNSKELMEACLNQDLLNMLVIKD